jgi:hypothetical protein
MIDRIIVATDLYLVYKLICLRYDMKKSKQDKLIDNEIDLIYRQNCSNIQVSIMDIGKIFEVGRKAKLEGRDMKQAIVDFVETIRKN